MKHINIPVFIPHLGCPNQCVFCNQRAISGVQKFEAESVVGIIEDALKTVGENDEVEIAFFGGSFTGIESSLMIELLNIAHSYVASGRVDSIRCSTRPDYINEQIVEILKLHGVKVVELGLQTVSDDVLAATKRNHTFEDEKKACKLIVESGIDLVGQMMIGLPGASAFDEEKTADFIIASGAKAARVYPTVVFRETELCDMSMRGAYKPLTLEEAVNRSASVVKKFREAGVSVIRIGLCASDNLVSEDTYFAGPNHPALGELVENRIYCDRIEEAAKKLSLDCDSVLDIKVARGELSKAVGQKKKNKKFLIGNLGIRDISFSESDELLRDEISVNLKRKENKCI